MHRRFPVLAALVLVVALALTAGCGAALSTPQITSADRALHAAREAGAGEFAVYEFTLATAYLDKAREEWAHSDHQKAKEYAEAAAEFAGQAVRRATGATEDDE